MDDSVDNHYRTRTSTGGAHRATMVAATPANSYAVNSAITSLPLTLTDDDVAGIVVVPPTGGFNTRENGADLTFGVRLTSQPAGGSLDLYVYVYESWLDLNDPATLVLTDEIGPAQQYVQKGASGWNTPAAFTLTPEDDALPDGDQGFVVYFLAESSGAGASSHPAYTAYFARSQSQGASNTWERRVNGANADDEVLPDGISFIVLPATISESDDPATTDTKENETTVTVAQAGTSGLDTTVTVTANPAFTMTPADGVVTIPAGSTTTTLTLTAVDNTVDAPDLPLFITATASNSLGTVTVTRGSLTITDDDDAPTVQLSLFPSSVSENGGTTRVTARLSHASSEATTVTVTADPAFTTPGGRVITIAAGDLSGSLQLRAVDRPGDADSHTVTVAATAANDQGEGAVQGATLTITDDDPAPTVTLKLTRTSLRETDDTATTGITENVTTVTASLDYMTSAATTVTLSSLPGAYTVSTNAVLTIAAGATESTGTVTLTAVDNSRDELLRTVDVTATTTSTRGIANPAPVTITIEDDDPSPRVHLTARRPWTIAEGTVLKSDGVTPHPQTVVVVARLDRTAESDVTVTLTPEMAYGSPMLTSGTEITITAGSLEGTATLTTVNDNIHMPARNVRINGAANSPLDDTPLVVTTAAVVQILDDDESPTLTLHLDPATISEDGGTTTVTATLDHPSAFPTTVRLLPATGYTVSTNAVLSIAALATESTGVVTLTAVDNDLDEEDATVTVRSSNPTNSLTVLKGTAPTLTIVDDEGAPTTLTLTVDTNPTLTGDQTSLGEGAGSVVEVTAAPIGSALFGDDVTVTVDVGKTGDSAVEGTDYETVGRLTITIPAGQPSGNVTFALKPVDDEIDEANETISVEGTASGLTVTPATITIIDNDGAPTVTLSLDPASISENGGTTTVTAELNSASSVDTTVTVADAPSGEFTLSTNKDLTIAAGAKESTGTVTLTAVDNDVDAPDATVEITATASNSRGVTNPAPVTLTITDDDTVPGVPTGVGATAGDEQVEVSWTAPADGGTSTITRYDVRHIAGDASDKSDANWTVVNGGPASPHTVTGLTNGQEYDFQVRAVNAAGPSAWTATVTATPAVTPATVTIAGPSANVAEDGTMAFTLTRTEDTTDALTVTVAVTETGAMLPDTLPTTATFAAGSATASVSLNLPGDVVDEPDSVVTVTVRAGSGYSVGTPASATGTATDDDTVPGVPTGVGATAGDEQVEVSWTAPTNAGTSAITRYDVRHIAGDASDKSDGNWTVVNGGSASPHTVTGLTNSTVYDFQVRAVSAAGPGGWTATVTAIPADPTLPAVSVTGPSASVAEDGTMEFTLTRTEDTTDALTVNVRVTETGDMLPSRPPITMTATFAAGSATASVSLNLPGDAVDEPNSVVTVAVRAGDGYSVGTPASATGTATDDDEVPGVPTGVGATAGHEHVAVSWTAPTNAGTSPVTGYDVRHIESAATDKSDARWTVVNAGNVTRHTVTGLTNDTGYDFQVRAVSAAGPGGWTATVTATPDASAVSTVTIAGPSASVAEGATMVFTLTRTAPTTNALTVTVSVTETQDMLITSKQWRYPCWLISPRACDLPTTATFAAGSATATVSLDLAGDVVVEPDSVITVGVVAGTGYILGSPSSATGTATDDDFGPGAPTVRISPGGGKEEEGETLIFFLERNPAPTALTVNVRVTETGDMLYWRPTTVTIGAGRKFGWLHLHTRDDNLAEPDSIVTVDLLKGNGYNVGNISTQTKTGIDHDPGAPTGVTTTPGDAQVTVSWTAPADDAATPAVTSYEVRHRESAAGNWTVVKGLAASPHTVTGLTDGQAYDFQVRAVNAKGISAWTGTSRATTYASTVTIAGPSANVVEGGTMVFTLTHTGETTAELTVTVRVTETGDMLPSSLPTTVTFPAGQSTATVSLNLPGDIVDEPNSVVTVTLTDGATYNLGSPSSATGTATDDDRAPGVPTGVGATAGNALVEVSWEAPDRGGTSAITGYEVRYIASDASDKSDADTWTEVDGGSTSSREVTVTGLDNGQEYDFQVRTVSAAGPSGWTGTVTATPTNPTAPAVTIAGPSARVAEDGMMAFTLTRTEATTAELTVTVQVTESGAMLPDTLPTMATFAVGSATATVSLDLPGDVVDEPDSMVTVAVRGGDGYNLGTPSSATVTATDDDTVPGVPTGVSTTAGDAQVEVTWTAPANAGTSAITRYDVRHIASDASDKSDGNWTVVDGGSASPHTVTGLTNGTGYDFQVRAVSAAGPSGWTATVTAIPADPTLPAVTIAGPSASVAEDGKMAFTLTRTASTTAALTVNVAVTETGAMLPDTPPTTATFAAGQSSASVSLNLPGDAVDEPDSDVTVTVQAGSGYSVGTPSSATGTATDNDTVPGVPTGVSTTAGDAQVQVSWTAPANAGTSAITRYDVRHIASDASDKSDGNWTVVNGGSASPHTVTGLTNGTGYDFQVRAVGAAGSSGWTATVTATPAAPTGPLPAVTIAGPSASVAEDGTMAFTLTRTGATTDALPVTVQVTETGAMLPSSLPTTASFTAGSATATVSLNLPGDAVDEPDSDVTVTVQAGSGYSVGTPSSATGTATDNDTVPGVPTGVSTTAGDAQVQVSWTAPANAGTSAITRYDVRHIASDASDKSDGNWTVVNGGSASPHTVTGLTNGTGYDFQVRAVGAAGSSGWTATVTATPAAPTGPLPAVTIAGPSASVAEDGTMVFTLTRTGATTAALTVNVRVTETGAMLPSSLPTTVTFAAGSATATVSLNLPGDELDEPDSVITVTVQAGTGYNLGTPSTATGTAIDDDDAPTVNPRAPRIVSATPGDAVVTLQWDPPANPDGTAIWAYDVRIKFTSDTDLQLWIPRDWVVSGCSTTCSYEADGLINGHSFDFQVRAVYENGTGPWSPVVRSTPNP
ncbi:MAG: hypothetical protein F4X26_09955 [Chloroflexi bacterium]|nr:hypothetical protein [Chloroflexota bacterium]